jgi:hypothetical protein
MQNIPYTSSSILCHWNYLQNFTRGKMIAVAISTAKIEGKIITAAARK